MERFTQKQEEGYVVLPGSIEKCANGYKGEPVTRLGQFEDAFAHLVRRQAELAAELEKLRTAGKKNSVKFRELLGEKLMNGSTLALLKTFGIFEE